MIGDAALDTDDLGEAAVMRDVGCLRGPRRHGAEAREHEKQRSLGLTLCRRAVGEDALEHAGLVGRERLGGRDEVNEARIDAGIASIREAVARARAGR